MKVLVEKSKTNKQFFNFLSGIAQSEIEISNGKLKRFRSTKELLKTLKSS